MSEAGGAGDLIGQLVDEINSWVERSLADWEPPRRFPSKVVRDPVHDFISLEPHEAAIWDLPFVQRLRYIHQTGLTYLVYPGAIHTRFDHSLGVMHAAQRMIDAIASRGYPVDPVTRAEIRLAGLLHDVGHVPFSHIGEDLLQQAFPGLKSELSSATYNGQPRFFEPVALGEVLSYLIVTSPKFVAAVREGILDQIEGPEGAAARQINLERVARLIIGRREHDEPAWPVNIINGSFDADKIDYLMRDCYFTGIRSELDTSRLLHSLTIADDPNRHDSLAVMGNSINYLEQVLLAKLTLYTAIYHHHKVRALQCMMRGALEDESDLSWIARPSTITDWLELSEYSFFTDGSRGGSRIVRDILNRRVLKRCLVLDRITVPSSSHHQLMRLSIDITSESRLRDLRNQIHDGIPKRFRSSVHNLWVDMPQPPDVDQEALQCAVQVAPGEVRALSTLIPMDDWVRAYVTNKLRGHVFYSGPVEALRAVSAQAERVFEQAPYNLQLNPLARALALKEW